ncbi:hypothetical protein C0Q70_09540 [Pomacea canaliculata]|uniref:Uncharacterized protein n=1 Tax=Pomacea canaliculata TaxID=400727 RepID=A0A2T7PA44_POMCA|nr:hypothetical protein C0Q70_09540 [Pomacea canaliculata]
MSGFQWNENRIYVQLVCQSINQTVDKTEDVTGDVSEDQLSSSIRVLGPLTIASLPPRVQVVLLLTIRGSCGLTKQTLETSPLADVQYLKLFHEIVHHPQKTRHLRT